MKRSRYSNYFNGFLSDYRIEKRAEKVLNDMQKTGNVVVNKFCSTFKDKKAAYELFKNPSFTEMELIDAITAKCKANQVSEHLLCIQDTTEINYTKHIGRIGRQDTNIGPVTKNDNAGYFCHPMLVVDAKQHLPIGFSSVQLWNRSWDKKSRHEREYQKLNIEDKESYRWIRSAQQTQDLLPQTSQLTIIGDREADIYEELTRVPNKQTHLLIRSCINRRLYRQDIKLFDYLEAQPLELEYELPIQHNKKRKKRIAKMSLRYAKVKIAKPKSKTKKPTGDPEYIEMYTIEAREFPETVPKKEEPILWRLLTTHQISNAQDALQCIEWYSTRWIIEELFRILKSKGMQIEDSQLETGVALKKQLIMALQVALTTMTLKIAYDKNHVVKANILFSPSELDFIQILNQTMEGDTQKQKNPFNIGSIAYCSWVFARLSGWSGYASQPRPGYISLKRGLDIFRIKYEGYSLAMSVLNNNELKG
ncbi:IS4 family transposase [Labilibacter marinus]|uniref:IS4 family transposase n=1 Tax=Labilibacter marinus TaxID=1477105 RepID=UPI0009F9CE25|nr:IS4 family transposase [Labilibacter marinus]